MRAVRWSDNDRYLGPFTFSRGDHYRTIAISVQSGDEDERKAYFRLSVGRFSFLAALPPWLIRPERKQVQAKYWSPDDVARMGRDWYWDATPREYGFSITDGHLSVHYGRVTNDSSTEQQWGYFLPWTQWRHIRRSLYDLDGRHFWSELDSETDNYRRLAKIEIGSDLWRERYDIIRSWEEMCPKATFRFKDFDGEELEAVTHLEQREWRFGTGWFKWLSFFRKPKIRSSLSIAFSGETGKRKGSWKGGTTGHSIEMLPGDLHQEAFERYCQQHEMTFVGGAGPRKD